MNPFFKYWQTLFLTIAYNLHAIFWDNGIKKEDEKILPTDKVAHIFDCRKDKK